MSIGNEIIIVNPFFRHLNILFTLHYPQTGCSDGELPSDYQAAKPIWTFMQIEQSNFQIASLAGKSDLF